MVRKHWLSARVVMPLVIAVAGMTAMAGTAIAQTGASSAASGGATIFPSFAAMTKAAATQGFAPAVVAAPQPGVAPAGAAFAADDAGFFYTGTDGAVYLGLLAPKAAPVSLGGHLTGGPAPAAVPAPLGPGIALFGRGTDNAMWEFTTTSWISVGGHLTSKPAVAAGALTGGDRIFAFVRGTDGKVYYKAFTATTQTQWITLGGNVAAGTDPAAVNIGGTMYVFVVGTDGALWRSSTTNGTNFTGWVSMGGHVSGPAAASATTGTAIAFGRGTDSAAWYNQFLGGTAGWKSLGGHITSGLGTAWAIDGSGTIWVLGLGSDNRIWTRTGVWPALGAWTKVF
ncbi:MAG: hypothetical protein ACM3ML_35035 [Micromonosporaceae bacterium]